MKYLFLILVGFLLLACEKEEPYNICDDLGFNPNPPPKFEQGFYMTGLWNGKDWKPYIAAFAVVSSRLGFGDLNRCNLLKYSCGIDDIAFVNTKQTITKSRLYFNYGQIDEIVTSQYYDSLVVSPDFENFIIFDYIAPDTSIVEGRFQLHLTKRWCFTFDDGTLAGCDTPPDYIDGEPKDIIITDGKFRIKRLR